MNTKLLAGAALAAVFAASGASAADPGWYGAIDLGAHHTYGVNAFASDNDGDTFGGSLKTNSYDWAGFVRLGYREADFVDGGSDQLVDALVVWGDEAAIRARIQQHWDAGADHVCIQPVNPDASLFMAPDERVLEVLAPGRGATHE